MVLILQFQIAVSSGREKPYKTFSMRCIFCKLHSSGSKSREHIIPESLGNTDHVLPAGWVCDTCNNYFSRKIEAPFLESVYGLNSRFEMKVPNKKGVIPPAVGMHFPSGTEIHMRYESERSYSVAAVPGADETRYIDSKLRNARGELIFLAPTIPPDTHETARFIAKIALEIFAYRGLDVPGWNNEIVDKIELDELRRYVRAGNPKTLWPVSMRRIYPAPFPFSDSRDPVFQVLHEFDLLLLLCANEAEFEVYAVIAIFGVEYAINLGGPELDRYQKWLKDNGERSYLYSKGSNESIWEVLPRSTDCA